MNKGDSIYKSPFVHRENYIMIIHKRIKTNGYLSYCLGNISFVTLCINLGILIGSPV